MALVRLEDQPAAPAPAMLDAGDATSVQLPDGFALFSAEFTRSGPDLTITAQDGQSVLLIDYFRSSEPADLMADNGAVLRGTLAERLAGPEAPGQYAQAGAASGTSPIGQVETVDGSAQVQRADGTVEVLQIGSKIYANDLVETGTGASVSLTFVDGTIFTLAAGSRMVIDDLIFDPGSTQNSGSFDLIEGGFVFIAGQLAKTGGFDVTTPTATMGIRGTTVLVDVQTENGITTVEVALTRDPDGEVGEFLVRDPDGSLIANITQTDTKWIISPIDGLTREAERTVDDTASDSVLIADAFAAYQSALARIANGETFVQLEGSISTPDIENGEVEDGELFDPGTLEPLEDGAPPPPPSAPNPGAPDNGPSPFDEGSITGPDLPTLARNLAVEGQEDAAGADAIRGIIAQNSTAVFTLSTAPANGTVVLSGNGGFVYTPNPDFNGTDAFTYTVDNGEGPVSTGTVTVVVRPVNDAPVAEDTQVAGGEDGRIIGALSATDVDGDPLTFSLLSGARNGDVVVVDDGTFSYTPDPDFNGTDSFVVEITDNEGGRDTATVGVTISPVNDAPEFQNQAVASTEDGGPVPIDLSAAVRDPDAGDAPGSLTYRIVSAPSEGTALLSGPILTFDPGSGFQDLAAGETRVVLVRVSVEDSAGEVAESTVTITVTGTNDAPVATSVDTAGAVLEDDPNAEGPPEASGQLTASDPDSAISWSGDAETALGSFTVAPDGAWRYVLKPAAAEALAEGEEVTESFTVTVTDTEGASDTETVTITVTGTNDAPVASSEAFVTEGDSAVSGRVKIADVDNGSSATVALGERTVENGTLSLAPDGSFTYEPNEGFSGVDRFDVVVTDDQGATAEATVTFVVTREALEVPGGPDLGIDIETEGSGSIASGAVNIEIAPINAPGVNVVIAMDSSASIRRAGWEEQRAAVSDALELLSNRFAGSATAVTVQIVNYSTTAESLGPFDLQDDIDDLLSTVDNLTFLRRSTNWELALQESKAFFDAQNDTEGEANLLFFITDGNPFPASQNWQGAAADLTDAASNGYSVDLETFGIGEGFNPALLATIDSDGTPTLVEAPSDLTDAFQESPLFNAELVDFSLSLIADGIDKGEIANEDTEGLEQTGLSYTLSFADIDGLADQLGAENLFLARGVFDLDGDPTTTGDQVTLLSAGDISRAAEAQSRTGSAFADVLLGSDEADSLDGAGGGDVLLGFGGQDTLTGSAEGDRLNAGDGDDVLQLVALSGEATDGTVFDGGAGRDVLEVLIEGDVTEVLLSQIELRDIEALDLDNGEENTLTLGLSDLLDLSSEGDAVLEGLLGRTLGESAIIYGDAGDSLVLQTEAGISVREVAIDGGLSDGAGTNLAIFEFTGGGGAVLATLGVDEEIAVSTAATA